MTEVSKTIQKVQKEIVILRSDERVKADGILLESAKQEVERLNRLYPTKGFLFLYATSILEVLRINTQNPVALVLVGLQGIDPEDLIEPENIKEVETKGLKSIKRNKVVMYLPRSTERIEYHEKQGIAFLDSTVSPIEFFKFLTEKTMRG